MGAQMNVAGSAAPTALSTIRRGFVDLDDGQVHFREAGERSDHCLVVLHPSPGSSLMMKWFIAEMGRHCWTVGLDTRGNGDSDPLPAGSEIPDFAASVWRTLDALGVKSCDLLGSHTGAGIAVETSLIRPQSVAHLVIDNLGLWSPERQKAQIAFNSPSVEPDQIGSQFNWAWHYVRDQQIFSPWYRRTAACRRSIDLPSAEFLHEMTVEVLKALGTYNISYSAAARFDKRARLPLITVPTLVTSCDTDPLRAYCDEVVSLVPGARYRDAGCLEEAEGAAAAARVVSEFLGV
ncbi:MAG: alpha/beta fold hydrolase [Flavobacteriaceae bacterium]